MKRDPLLYLDDVLEAIQRIEEYSRHPDYSSFKNDKQAVDAIIRNFEVMGEAAKKMPVALRNKHPDIPWIEMAGMRDKLIHEYFGVNTQILWKTVKDDLPKLKSQVVTLSQELQQDSI